MRTEKPSKYVMISNKLLKDINWRKLTSSAKVLYLYLKSKFNTKARTLGDLVLTYGEMKGVMTTDTMSRGFKELQRAGFIEKVKQGGLYGSTNMFRLKGEHRHFWIKGKRVG